MHLLLKIMKLYFLELIKKSGIKFTSWLSMVVRVFSLFVMFSIGVLGSPWFSWFSLGFHSFSWFFVVFDNFWRLVSFTGIGSQVLACQGALSRRAKGPWSSCECLHVSPKLTVMTKNKRTSETFGDNVPVSGGNLLR